MTAVSRAVLEILFAGFWQGACIAIASQAAVLVAGRRIGAATRCAIFQLALLALAVVPVATTLPHLFRSTANMRVSGYGSFAGAVARFSDGANFRPPHIVAVAIDDRIAIALAACWTIGLAAFAVRLIAGSFQLARLLRQSVRFEVRDGVTLYQSCDLVIPLACGFRTPAIVLPAALVRKGGDQLDCIVRHELAHVRRGDAWQHLCERLIQALLYVNPAVPVFMRWISLERESACDDVAVGQLRQIDPYVRALASFAISGADARTMSACGASGFGRATLARIHRLEDARRNGATTLSRFTLGGCTIVLALIALTFQSLAPAVAFEAPSPQHRPVIASFGCKDAPVRYLNGPPPDATGLPGGLRTTLNVRLSATGKVLLVSVRSSSGNSRFDRAVVASAKAASFSAAAQNCRTVPGSYVFTAQTGP